MTAHLRDDDCDYDYVDGIVDSQEEFEEAFRRLRWDVQGVCLAIVKSLIRHVRDFVRKGLTMAVTQKRPKVICTKCQRHFTPVLLEPKVRGGVRQHFRCPWCLKDYPVARISDKGLTLRKQLQKERDPVRQQEILAEYQKEVTRLAEPTNVT